MDSNLFGSFGFLFYNNIDGNMARCIGKGLRAPTSRIRFFFFNFIQSWMKERFIAVNMWDLKPNGMGGRLTNWQMQPHVV